MKRQITNRHFDLREWQAQAFRKVVEYQQEGKKDFLCVATPGSGKTKFALMVAHHFLIKDLADRICVVTPSKNLKEQWAIEAANFAGIDIDPDFSNCQGYESSDYYGMSITYALLGQDKKQLHQMLTNNRRTLVILDEIHHAGDELSWGNAIKVSFDNAVFRLALSGTPFRSDDNPIPFVRYNENKYSISDFNYSYEQAIKDNVCRPVYFSTYDGQMKWKVGQEEFTANFTESLTPDQVSKRLRTALSSQGNYVKDILTAANAKLTEVRATHKNAAGLIFAVDQSHAREIAKVLYSLTGEHAPIVISDEGKGSEKINTFKNNNERWMVSVKMVSEGIDIPRLRVGVYFTNVKAEMFFRQAVGRFVRVLSGLQFQDAFVFLPQDRDLVKLAESIQEERDHALDHNKFTTPGDQGQLFNDYTPALRGKFIPLDSVALESKTIAVSVELSSGMKSGIDTRRGVTSDDPVYLQKHNLKEQCNNLARRIAIKYKTGDKPDWRMPHRLWIDRGGKNIELETIEELSQRLSFFRRLFVDIRQVA